MNRPKEMAAGGRIPGTSNDSRRLWPAALAVLLLLMVGIGLTPPARADVDTQIVTPSTQALTNFVQTGGTFTACADSIDGTTCDYQEQDAGDGALFNSMLLANANGAVTDWTANGCTEANEYQCVDEGPVHDGDATYANATLLLGPLVSRYGVQGCNDALPPEVGNLCAASALLHVTTWAYTRIVATAKTDPTLVLELQAPDGTNCYTVATTKAVTGSYANYTEHDDALCSWTNTLLNGATVFMGYSCPEPGDCDQMRTTAAGVTVNWRAVNYRGTVQYDFTSVKKGGTADSVLVIRMAVASGESWSCDTFDWLANGYDTAILSFTSTSQTERTYDLIEQRHVSTTGGVRFRCVDQNQSADETQGTISMDSAFVRTTYTEETNTGGGDIGQLLFLSCDPGFLETPCSFTLNPQAAGVFIERTDWYADGKYFANGTAASGNRHTAVLEGFHLRGAVNVTVYAHFDNGQTLTVSKRIAFDNSWLVWLVFLLVLALAAWVAIRHLARKGGSR